MKSPLQLLAVAVLAAATGAGAVWYFQAAPSAPPVSPGAVDATATPPPHAQLPHMQVQAQYGGPLPDTLIQRLRDPVDGTICYLYLPVAVHHTAPGTGTGYVEYGANSVGAISCYAPLVQVRVAPPPVRPAAPAAPR
jgi:hypothetical protein